MTLSCGARPVGKKRGMHILDVKHHISTLYVVYYKRNKCRHAKVYINWVPAIDELDAYLKAKRGDWLKLNQEGVSK